MHVFVTVLRVIFTIPALILGLLLRFLAVVFGLAIEPIERGATLAAGLLASATTTVLVIALIVAAGGGDGIGFIRSYWYVWLILYGIAGIIEILPSGLNYITAGLDTAGDWLMMIPPWN